MSKSFQVKRIQRFCLLPFYFCLYLLRPIDQLREGREFRRNMRFFTTLFLFSLLTISIFAQQNGGSISGQIVENSNSVASAKILKENIQNKTVTLMSKNDNKVVAETTTDKDGNFSFDSVQSGDYWIFVDCDYCLRNSVREEISVSSGQTLKLKIELPKF
mgnify:CR=1 FL=1